jgi:hypothetical protein
MYCGLKRKEKKKERKKMNEALHSLDLARALYLN